VSELQEETSGQAGRPRNSTRLYMILSLVLIAVIVVASVLLVTKVLPALRGGAEPTAIADVTLAPTFTPAPTKEPTNTPPPSPSPTIPIPEMHDTDTPIFSLESAGARPSPEWTGFFGQVKDAQADPLSGVLVIVWYGDGTAASPIVRTDKSGNYEVRLADAPLAGSWSIQLLAHDGQPASKLFTFNTDENSDTGVQQIQVIWQQASP
jgi:hypothetical protein